MHIDVNDKTTIREIQDTFSNFYPYLKLEFYKKPHKKYEVCRSKDNISPEKTVGEIRETHLSALIEMRPMTRAGALEEEFQQRFGLSVQVVKKEGNDWEQTTVMDDFTLRDLNELGRSSSDEFILADEEDQFEEIGPVIQ